MSRRPPHLVRRQAVFYVRFRIPAGLCQALGRAELNRSLQTTDYSVARRRCLAATVWFWEMVERLNAMVSPDRAILEQAAIEYFRKLIADVDQPRDFPAEAFASEVAAQTDAWQEYLEKQDAKLTGREHDAAALAQAQAMLEPLGLNLGDLDDDTRNTAVLFALRAERQQATRYLHSLKSPASTFIADDDLFRDRSNHVATLSGIREPSPRFIVLRPEITLERGITMYREYQERKGWGGSMRDESLRVMRWLKEEIDPQTPVSLITRDQIREFRDCLLQLAKGAQGRKLPLRQRLTPGNENLLKFVSRARYWRFATALFSWLEAELSIPDQTAGLRFEGGKNEIRQSPEAFSSDEIRQLVGSPLFSGSRSRHRRWMPGTYLERDAFWWAGVLMLFTGMRAGDIAQLVPSDFRLDDEVPHLVIAPGKLPDGTAKTSKFFPRTHKVPLLPILFELGLREFVQRRAKRKPIRRLLHEVRVGDNRSSDGMTKFWGRYLRRIGLYSHGRGTHVFRHTLIAHLRAAGVSNEDIKAVVGHQSNDVTEGYGGPQPLSRTFATLSKLDFGFDLLEALEKPNRKKLV